METYLNAVRGWVESMALGYWVMAAIFLCSVVALTIFLERLWYLRWKKIFPREFFIEIQELLRRGKVEDALTLCKKDDSPLARLLMVGLSSPKESIKEYAQLKERLEEMGRHEAHRLEGSSEVLGTIAGISPLLGLLGTALGMVEVFGVISQEGIGNPTMLASGIATALITTVFGIAVAIPSLVAYKYFMGKVKTFVIELEYRTAVALDSLQHPPKKAA